VPAKSHVDFCLFVQILEVEEDRIPPELVAAIQSRNPAEIARTLDSLPTLRNIVDDQTNLHESIHIVQGVIYRFLRWYSLAAFQYVSDTFKQMDELTAAAQSVNATSLHSPIFSLLDMEWHIYDMSKRFLFWKYKPALGISITDQVPKGVKAKPLITLNTIDLIENAASLLQYKISTGNDFPTWIEFSRWAKRNPAYTRILEFVRDYLGDGNVAVRIFLDLVQVAFDTNRPVQAFAILLAAFKYNYDKGYLDPILAQRGHCRWIEIFDHYAGKMPLEKPEYGNLLSKRFFRIESDLGLRLGGKMTHPILGHFVTKWEKLEANDIAYRYAFGAPNGYSKHISEISELFHAPITLLKLTNEEQNFVSVIGNLRNTGVADADIDGTEITDIHLKGVLVGFMMMFGVVRRLVGALMDPDFRFCHHIDCPFYAQNYCNMWLFIPKKYDDCGFPRRFTELRGEWFGRPGTSSEFVLVVGNGPNATADFQERMGWAKLSN